MKEIHTIDFDRFGVNVVSDGGLGIISLQFDTTECGMRPIEPLLKAVKEHFGRCLCGYLSRWLAGEGDLLLLNAHERPHPDNPDVICVEMTIKEGQRMDRALAALMNFFRRQPGYRRTLGSPLDRDDLDHPIGSPTGDASSVACDTLKRMFENRRRGRAGRRQSLPDRLGWLIGRARD